MLFLALIGAALILSYNADVFNGFEYKLLIGIFSYCLIIPGVNELIKNKKFVCCSSVIFVCIVHGVLFVFETSLYEERISMNIMSAYILANLTDFSFVVSVAMIIEFARKNALMLKF